MFAKKLGLNGREMEKEEKRNILPGNFCEGEWQDDLPNLLDRKQLFFSARHNRIVKNVKIGETIFQDFFRENFFNKKKIFFTKSESNTYKWQNVF